MFAELFPNAKLQLCFFHVSKAFNDELTTAKRAITPEERDTVLALLGRILYADTVSQVNDAIADIARLELGKLQQYLSRIFILIVDIKYA